MDFIFRALLVACLFQTPNGVDIMAKEGGAGVFYLPPYNQRCGPYTLFDPQNKKVLTVNNNTRPVMNPDVYGGRGNDQVLPNGTIMFALHHVTDVDTGTYKVQYSVEHQCQSLYFSLTLVDASAKWLPWGQWSACSRTCGVNGVKQRSRICTKLGQCQGEGMERQRCQLESCTKTYWTSWGPWSPCSETCGMGSSFRTRSCTGTDVTCPGDSKQLRNCKQRECTLAAWTDWSHWTSCSKTCDAGTRTRRRQCKVSADDATGACVGVDSESETCNSISCFHKGFTTTTTVQRRSSYTWTAWSEWSVCGRGCGRETRERFRQCTLHVTRQEIPPEYCGSNKTKEVSTCNNPPCNNGQDAGRSDYSSDGKSAKDIGVTVPLSGIVGTVAAFVIIILLVILIVLVTRLRKKNRNRRHGVTSAFGENSPIHQEQSRKQVHVPKLSVSGCRDSSSHCYAEIDDDVCQNRNTRVSVVTIDNPYSELPKSASTSSWSPTADNGVSNKNAGNEKKVFLFGNQSSNNYLTPHSPQTEHRGRDKDDDENCDGGYLTCTPDSSLDHLSRRPKRFVKLQK